MRDYVIRDGVPLPSAGKTTGLSATLRRMTVGQSTDVPAEQRVSVHACARSVGAKVRTRSNEDGTVTVWCVSSSTKPEPVASSQPQSSEKSSTTFWPDWDLVGRDLTKTIFD